MRYSTTPKWVVEYKKCKILHILRALTVSNNCTQRAYQRNIEKLCLVSCALTFARKIVRESLLVSRALTLLAVDQK